MKFDEDRLRGKLIVRALNVQDWRCCCHVILLLVVGTVNLDFQFGLQSMNQRAFTLIGVYEGSCTVKAHLRANVGLYPPPSQTQHSRKSLESLDGDKATTLAALRVRLARFTWYEADWGD